MISSSEIILAINLGLLYAIVALGIYITLSIIKFTDLSCDGSFMIGTAIAGTIAHNNQSPFIALVLSILAGGLIGIITANLTTKIGLSDVLSGIIVTSSMYSLYFRITSGLPNIFIKEEQTIFYQNHTHVLMLILFFLIIILHKVFTTDFGLAIRSLAGKKELPANHGIQRDTYTMYALCISNGLIALAGTLYAYYQNIADISQSQGTLITGIAGVMLAELFYKGRTFYKKFFAIIIGCIMYRIIIMLALYSDFFGLQTTDINILSGFLTVIFIVITKRKSDVSA